MKQINLPMKKSFLEFMSLCEAVYDKDVMGRSQIKKEREGGRVGADRRKTQPEKRRMKAVGGGKVEPAKTYKDRKDIGTQKKRSEREQQPTKERGTAGLSPREQQRKAAMERRAAKTGAKPKTADELLRKKAKAKVSPDYKPQKASGMTRAERMKVTRKGETKLRNIMKDTAIANYKKETGQDPDKKAKQKIMGRVHQQMRT
tara:strand:+ start:605 stop:1210 length:606 start_codon:yes stop_codon:yes gene_type:complete